MNEIVHYTHCPACGATDFRQVLNVKDYTVSNQEFPIVECSICELRFTQDVPGISSIGAYYKSENYISHTDTSRGFVNALYKIVRKRTLRKKRKLVENISRRKAGTLLDVGAGTGAFLNEMREHGWNVTGVEPDEDARNLATKTYGIRLQQADEFFRLSPGSFDMITLWHVLEHVHDLQGYMNRLKQLLATHGCLVIAVPNYTCFDEKVYKQYWAAYDVPRHLYHFSPVSMNRLVEKHGLLITGYQPMWYDSFYVSLLSSGYKNGKTNWPGAIWTGFLSNLKAVGNTKKCSSVIYMIRK